MFMRLLAGILWIMTLSPFAWAVTLVKFEAESGILGTEWTTGTNGGVQYIAPTTDRINDCNPGSTNRVATYTVTFPAAGLYQLYARMRVGPDAANDDSLFYANSFGIKVATTNTDWVTMNGIGGFNNSADVVTGAGTTTSGVWKWINLSQKAGSAGFTVTAGNLTQTFQVGARENGLDLDQFGFGMSGVSYTVADLDTGGEGTLPSGTATVNWNDPRQLMDGFGAGVVFLNGGATFSDANADKLFKRDTTSQLGLTLLRVRIEPNSTWTNSVSAWSGSLNEAKKAATRGAGVLATPWTPPAAMKDNGSLINGGAVLPAQYANYAAYLEKYASNLLANGVSLRAISIQNEPDWAPDYESCVWSGAQFLNFFRTNAPVIQSAPIMMPEALGFNFSLSDPALNDSSAVTNIDFIGGHLYGVAEVNGMKNIPAYANALTKGKRVWQTEYLINDQSLETALQTAREIHNCLTQGSMSAYLWWKCVSTQNGLLDDAGNIQRRGFVMAQFSRFVRPGYYRLGETNLGSGAVSGYKNPTNNQFAIIAINPYGLTLTQHITLPNFPAEFPLVPWITSATQSLATLPPIQVTNGSFTYALPANSIITFAGQAVFGPPGDASNPAPANGSVGVPVDLTLNWTPGSNTLTHAVYLGASSNAVALATPASPEFQGILATSSFNPDLAPVQTYYWRVDEIGSATNPGPVWTFTTTTATANYTLSATDSIGTSSFNAIGSWTNHVTGAAATTAPTSAAAYYTGPFALRTPVASGNYTFGGTALTISSGGNLLIKGGGGNVITVNNLTNAGTITDGINPNQIAVIAGTMTVAGGAFNVSSTPPSDNRAITNATTMSGSGALTNYGGGYVVYTGNNQAFTGPVVVTNTILQIAAQSNLGGNPASFHAAQLLLNNGTLQARASFTLDDSNRGITIGANGGGLHIGSGLTLTIANPIAGSGTLSCFGGGTLRLVGSHSATGSLILSNSTLVMLGNVTLQNSQLNVSNAATLDLTAQNGPLTINNRIALTGNLIVPLNKTNLTTRLVASNLVFGGTLTLSNTGPTLTYGDTLKLFNATNYSGAFSSIVPPVPGVGLVWNTNGLSVDGTIFVSASDAALLTPPRITNIELIGNHLIVRGTNGNAPGTMFHTLTTTNLALPRANWTSINTNPFGAGGSFIFTNTYDAAAAQRFFILRLP